MASLQTIEQERAKHALDKIQTVGDISEGKLSPYIVGMPAMILMSGFGQTCAFYVSKSKGNTEEAKAYQKVVDILWDWLGQGKHGDIFTGKSDLMMAITSCDATTYQLAQAESLAYLNWLKKFAKAYLKNDSEGGE